MQNTKVTAAIQQKRKTLGEERKLEVNKLCPKSFKLTKISIGPKTH